MQDRLVRNLPSPLRPGDVMVADVTRVIPAQLAARRGKARIGLTLDQPGADGIWHALARGVGRLRPGAGLGCLTYRLGQVRAWRGVPGIPLLRRVAPTPA